MPLVELFNDAGLDRYITIRCDRVVKADAATRFFNAIDHGKADSVNSAIDGPNDWVGAIEFKRDDLDEPSKATLGRVIRDDLKADILCLCEVEDRRTLQEFNDGMLGGLYSYNVLIEGNDPRGIDATRLNQAVTQCGAVYTGRFTDGTNGVPTPLAAASDHAAIWVDIKIPGLLHA